MHPQGKSSAVKQKDPGTVLACRDLTAIKLTWWSQQSPRALLRLAMQPTSLHISSHCSPGLRPSVLAMGCRLFSRASAQPCWVLREFHKRFGQGVCGIVSKCRTKRIERIICCQNVLTDI